MTTAAQTTPDTIVLIHGLWMTPRSWEHWAERYEERATPCSRRLARHGGRGRSPQRRSRRRSRRSTSTDRRPLREAHPRASTARRSSWATRSAARSRRSCSTAGSAPPASGSHPRPSRASTTCRCSTIRSQRRCSANPSGQGGGLLAEGVPLRVREHAQPRRSRTRSTSATPCRGRPTVLNEGAFANFHRHAPTKVDFEREDRAPMLLIGVRRTTTSSRRRSTRHQRRRSTTTRPITEYKEFPGRPHFPGAPGWEEVADYALDGRWSTRTRRSPNTLPKTAS